MSKRFSIYCEGALVSGLYMISENNPFFASITCITLLQDLEVDKLGTWATGTNGKKYYVIRDTDGE